MILLILVPTILSKSNFIVPRCLEDYFIGDYDRNQSIRISWFIGYSIIPNKKPSAGASPTLRSGSNGSSTLQRTQAGGGSLGGKNREGWLLMEDFCFLVGDLSSLVVNKQVPGNFEAKIQELHIFLRRVGWYRCFFSYGFNRFSCFFLGGMVPKLWRKKWCFPGFLGCFRWEDSDSEILVKWQGQRRDHILPLPWIDILMITYYIYVCIYSIYLHK